MRTDPDAVMLFGAGFGTRMGVLTADRPKPLIEVAGRALIDRALDLVADYGAARVVVNLHYRADQLARHLAGRDVALSHEVPDILDTGGGLRAALPLLGEGPVFTLNSDAVWRGPNPLAHLAARWQPARMDALLLCIPRPQARGHAGAGDFLVTEGAPARRGPGAIYSGLQILQPGGLDAIAQSAFSLNRLWDRMLAQERLFATAWPGQWCDVGTPEGLAAAEALLARPHV